MADQTIRDQLRVKAFLALEEAAQQCRYGLPVRSFALRFALAYLWSLRPTSRRPFDAFWLAIAEANGMWRFSKADQALLGIYVQLGVVRDDAQTMAVWRRCQEAHRASAEGVTGDER